MLLTVGFAYAGAASVRGYRRVFAQPRASGPSASIDDLIGVLQIDSIEVVRSAVARAAWPRDSDVVLVAAAPSMTPAAITQAHFALGYALYPRRVWLAPRCDTRQPEPCGLPGTMSDPLAVFSRHATRQLVLIGPVNPFPGSRSRRLSETLSLVQVR
jgi:hypothetical protein